ncbi:LacI family DNA-binding transcriptional regulator [Qaidamihabitans albus]|uniref:LacI family DNA-binding transcriptional regulator n=1 Tax=Qaidamihabitans albus TaxID=2795733 RepID=UPI0027DAF4A3|nr:LacI family DNA-binding transcriptional regulator [Qaidamihabitans albus]
MAREAGVSTAAVSKVLRNADGVSAAMRSKVRAAMTDLGYRPHAAARGMRGKTFTVGIVLDSIRNPFFADILDGVTDELGATDYQVLLGAGGFGAEGQAKLADAMVDRRMDGLILIAPGMAKADIVQTAGHVPLVIVGHHDAADEYDSVVDDDLAGAALVVDHLVALGHRRIAHTSTTGTRASGWSRTPDKVRSRGYREAMRRHGLAEHLTVAATSFSEEGGYQAAKELLGRPDPPTAIFAGADVAAFGVLRAAHELGLRVPEDLSLVGYDNTTTAALSPVQLTSVDQAGRTMGSTAARLLIERIDGRRHAMRAASSPTLVVRGTTAPPRAHPS